MGSNTSTPQEKTSASSPAEQRASLSSKLTSSVRRSLRPRRSSKAYIYYDKSTAVIHRTNTIQRLASLDESDVTLTQPDCKTCPYLMADEELENIDFPFENIVFEGGGSQGTAYIGAIMELERFGLLGKIRRFAGASVGSISATLLSLGYTSALFHDMLQNGPRTQDFLDAKCGACSLIPNFLLFFGWHPGQIMYDYIGEKVKEKLGHPDATFKDLYAQTGRELCVVVTNLTLMMEEYCHVKTTPDLPIRVAVRMSMAAPGIFAPVQRKGVGRTDVFTDGGLICNYPVHCFDGWWLSLKPEDRFLKRMQPLDDVAKLLTKRERFGTFNEKTLGFIILSDYDSHVLPVDPLLFAPDAPLPDTTFARAAQKLKTKRDLNIRQHKVLTDAMTRFLKVLDESDLDGNSTIDRQEFKLAFEKRDDFTIDHMRVLFGEHATLDELFDELDINHDGQIDFSELMNLADRKGIGIQTQHIGSGRHEIVKPTDFITGLFQSLLLNVKRAFLEGEDGNRTVVINTVYIKSVDFGVEPDDVNFLIEQGRRGFKAFLKQWKMKQDARQGAATAE